MIIKNKIKYFFYSLIAATILSCGGDEKKQNNEVAIQDNSSLDSIENPVLKGDFADPSVVRVGENYWATATSSEWAPLYPILQSTNLEDWKIVSHVFPDGPPDWAEANFWAPEIAYDNGKYYIYYTAKKKDGPLCVGVASSKNATGPYKDHGALVCQEAGAIDGFQIRDEDGDLFLIWKEDGNSRGEPTPMWGQQMNEERTQLVGEKFELFRNDPDTWEGNLVEGAYLLKKNGYYYAFYSGDACCGRGCTYGVGVARAKKLKGPWEKYENNPIKKENEKWKCAGHGTMVKTGDGRYFFLYHAYKKDGNVYTGRQGLLDEVVWEEDGWPRFEEKNTEMVDVNDLDIKDDFSGDELSQRWQWPVGKKPEFSLKDGSLILNSKPDKLGNVLAQRILTPDYTAVTVVDSINTSANSKLAAIGDQNNALGISVSGNEVVVWKVESEQQERIASAALDDASKVYLKMKVRDGEMYNFYWSEDGENWQTFPDDAQLNGSYLPPWDRAVRVGLLSEGSTGSKGRFLDFSIKSDRDDLLK